MQAKERPGRGGVPHSLSGLGIRSGFRVIHLECTFRTEFKDPPQELHGYACGFWLVVASGVLVSEMLTRCLNCLWSHRPKEVAVRIWANSPHGIFLLHLVAICVIKMVCLLARIVGL